MDILEFNFDNFLITKTESIDPKTGDQLIDYVANDLPALNGEHIPSIEYVFPFLILIPQTYQLNEETYHIFSSDSTL